MEQLYSIKIIIGNHIEQYEHKTNAQIEEIQNVVKCFCLIMPNVKVNFEIIKEMLN